ncbi:hypothetical protein JCM10213_005831 [Rhodosporidiobolus nylandii]
MSESEASSTDATQYWGAAPSAAVAGPPARSLVGAGRSRPPTNGSRRAARTGSATPQPAVDDDGETDLANVEAAEAGRLVDEDDTPFEDLSTSMKLVRAIHLLSGVLTANGGAEGAAYPNAGTLTAATYATVVGLLSSAVNDLEAAPPPDADLVVLMRDALNYRATGAAPPPPQLVSLVRPAFASDEERNLVGLFAQNSRLALAALRPDKYTEPEPQPMPTDLPTATPAYLENVPVEILIHIFSLAREEAAKPIDYKDTPPQSKQPKRLTGSPTAALRFALQLATVCKKWSKPARTSAFREIVIRSGPVLVKLNKFLASDAGAAYGAQINSIDALIVPAGAERAPPGRGGGFRRRGGPLQAQPAPQFDLPEAERNAGVAFKELVEKTKNLVALKLTISSGHARVTLAGYPIPGDGHYRDFLEAPVFAALTSVPTVRNLHLCGFTVDFEELESVFRNLPLLEDVHLSNVDALTGNRNVVSAASHAANRIRRFRIGDASSAHGAYSSLAPAQLAWLLEPSVASGSLKCINIAVMSDQGLRAGGGGGGSPPAFASAEMADLLVRCGASLESLGLQDIAMQGGMDPSFSQAPHNGSFDFALSHLTSLRKVVVPGIYTGSSLVASLTSIPTLRTIIFIGTPSQTSATALADALDTQWDKLKTFKVIASSVSPPWFGPPPAQAAATVWSGAERRRIDEISRRRGFKCELAR